MGCLIPDGLQSVLNPFLLRSNNPREHSLPGSAFRNFLSPFLLDTFLWSLLSGRIPRPYHIFAASFFCLPNTLAERAISYFSPTSGAASAGALNPCARMSEIGEEEIIRISCRASRNPLKSYVGKERFYTADFILITHPVSGEGDEQHGHMGDRAVVLCRELA